MYYLRLFVLAIGGHWPSWLVARPGPGAVRPGVIGRGTWGREAGVSFPFEFAATWNYLYVTSWFQ